MPTDLAASVAEFQNRAAEAARNDNYIYENAIHRMYVQEKAPRLVADLMAENERLRAALERIANPPNTSKTQLIDVPIEIARAALTGKDGGA